MLSPAARATECSPGLADSPWVPDERARKPAQRARDFDSALTASMVPTGAPTGKNAVARCAGSFGRLILPTARGLAVGFMLSPTAWAECTNSRPQRENLCL